MTKTMGRLLLILGLSWFSAAPAIAQGFNEDDLVRSWYRRYFGREPRPGEVNVWANNIRTGRMSELQAQAGILGSDEYFNRRGGNVQAFLISLFTDTIGRQPRPDELRYWNQQLASSRGNRVTMVTRFLQTHGNAIPPQPPLPPLPPFPGPGPNPGPFPPDFGGPSARLVSQVQLLQEKVRAELGWSPAGRQVLLRVNTLQQVSINLDQLLRVLGTAPQLSWQAFSSVEAAYQGVQAELAQNPGAAPASTQIAWQISNTLNNVRSQLPQFNPPDFDPGFNPIQQQLSRQAADLSGLTQQLSQQVRTSANFNPAYQSLLRDVDRFSSMAEGFWSRVRYANDLRRLRRHFREMDTQSRVVRAAIQFSPPNSSAASTWWSIEKTMNAIAATIQESRDSGGFPDNLPGPGPLPPGPNPNAMLAQTVGELSAFFAYLQPYSFQIPEVTRFLVNVRAMRDYLQQIQKLLSTGDPQRRVPFYVTQVRTNYATTIAQWNDLIRRYPQFNSAPTIQNLGPTVDALETLIR